MKIHLEKKHWVFMGLVMLLCVTGYVNYRFSENVGGQEPTVVQGQVSEPTASPDPGQTTNATLSYYANFRAERKTTREQEVAYLDSIIADTRTDAETLKDAQEQKMAIVEAMETETTVEGLIKAKGYADCVVTIKEGSVNVVVENEAALTSAQAAQIFEIVRQETGESNENIKIMPKN